MITLCETSSNTAADAIRYTPTADRCGKYQPRPDRFGSPWWYDADSFAGLVLATAELPDPPPLGAFLRSFDGLTSTARAKAVTGMLPVASLAELAGRLDLVPKLLAIMQAQAVPTPPARLGPIGKEHLHHALDEAYHVDGAHWYKKVDIAVGGVPWVLEVMVAQTAAPAQIHYLVNHTPVFADAFSKQRLSAGEISSWGGVAGLLSRAEVDPRAGEAVAVSVICPAPQFTDRGKTTMVVPPAVADAVARVIWSTSKVIYREQKAAERDARRQARQHRRSLVWQRISAGCGAKGHRRYDWALIDLAGTDCDHDAHSGHHALLVRRSRTTGELAFYRTWTPPPMPLGELVRVAGRRWAIEESFQAGKTLAGLDEHQLRRCRSWRRWTVLALLAHAFLAVTTKPADEHAGPRLTRLTSSEIQHLFAALVLRPIRELAHLLTWSRYRRTSAARARTSHYTRQAAALT